MNCSRHWTTQADETDTIPALMKLTSLVERQDNMLKKKPINKTISNSYTYKSDGMVRNHQWSVGHKGGELRPWVSGHRKAEKGGILCRENRRAKPRGRSTLECFEER